ncbi:cytochrome P450 6k1-like isoform X1 [Temnothorax nylanderi]|uniref:cytochrome P450 6k1-like isoform X1 n=1 Tax=Temnothorax nylanderi TaxID=102681 RepID=UPI003A83D7C9
MAFIMEYWVLDCIGILIILIGIAYYITRNFKYWKKRGVLEIPPTPFFGNFKECLFLKKSPSYFLKELYERKKDVPYIGFYIFNKPFLLLRDCTVIRHVLTADSNFDNRYSSADPKDRIGYANLFFTRESHLKWKFRIMQFFHNNDVHTYTFDLMPECGKHLDEYLDSLELNGNGQIMDVMDVSTKFTMDVIWSIAFGRGDVNTFQNPDSDYSRHAKTMLENNYRRTWKMLAIFFLPNLTRFLELKVFGKKTSDFMRKIFWETMRDRYNYISEYDEDEYPEPPFIPQIDPHPRYYKRYDLIDILVDIKWNVSGWTYTENFDLGHVEEDDLLAQAASFFLFGFETISTTVAFALYELALQPKIQNTLRNEILEVLKKSNGRVTHSMIQTSLPYLDMVVSETLRMYPPLGFLNYMAKKNYEVPEHNLVIEEGTPVYVSLLGLHYDSKYFRNPNIFDPERFNERNKRNIPEDVYIPFGRGERFCMAEKFGLVQTRLVLLIILSKYKVTRCEKTSIPVKIDPRGPMTVPLNNVLYLKVQKINPLAGCVHNYVQSKKKTKKTKKNKKTKRK